MSSINLNSESQCRKAIVDHTTGRNKISAKQLADIRRAYGSDVDKWIKEASKDKTEYEISEDDVSYKAGVEDMETVTGDVDTTNSTVGNLGTGALAYGANAGSKITSAISALGDGQEAMKALGVAGDATKYADKLKGLGKIADITKFATVGMVALVSGLGANYGTEKKVSASEDAAKELADAQQDILDAQAEIDDVTAESEKLADEGSDKQKTTNEDIKRETTDYNSYKNTYERLAEKSASGEKLTDEEQNMYEECVKYMSKASENIAQLQSDASETLADINSNITDLTESYTNASEFIASTQGAIDATDFQNDLKKDCETKAGMQSMNQGTGNTVAAQCMADGTKATLEAGLGLFTGGALSVGKLAEAAINFTLAGVSKVAANTSGKVAQKHLNYANEVAGHINIREATDNLNKNLTSIYGESLATYDTNSAIIKEAEIVKPDDVEAPKETNVALAQSGTEKTGESSGETLNMFGMPVENNQDGTNPSLQTAQNEQNINKKKDTFLT